MTLPPSSNIYWGWLINTNSFGFTGSVQSLPRVVTYHAYLQALVFNPLPGV